MIGTNNQSSRKSVAYLFRRRATDADNVLFFRRKTVAGKSSVRRDRLSKQSQYRYLLACEMNTGGKPGFAHQGRIS
jgi:hypothetical protein